MITFQVLTHIFIIYSIVFLSYMFMRWTGKEPFFKLSIFFITILGIFIELKTFHLI